MFERRFVFALSFGVAGWLCLCTCAHGQALDQIQTRGSRIQGKVASTTPLQVNIDVQGSKRSVKTNEIRYVSFAEEPAELKTGRAKILGGKYESGLADLKKLNPAEIQRDLIKRDLQFYLALASAKIALTSGGDKGAAEKAMLAFVRAASNSHHFFEAAEALGDLAFAQQNVQGAVRYYGAISSKAPFPDYKMRGLMAEARALVFQNQFSAALEKYDAIQKIESDTKEARRQKQIAQVGRGRCLAETKSPDEGIRVIEEIIAKQSPDDKELFGRAYNAHGDCLMKAGKAKDALLAYLHVDVLFYSEPEIHAEALYHLSKLWKQTKQNDRAVNARKLLDEKYSGSVWASRQ